MIFITSLALNFGLSLLTLWLGIGIDSMAYTNPLVVLQALGMVMVFSRLTIAPNRIINRVAKSAFAVYLFHNNGFVCPYFIDFCRYIYQHTGGICCLAAMFAAMVGVYILATGIDQIRLALWSWLRLRQQKVAATTTP